MAKISAPLLTLVILSGGSMPAAAQAEQSAEALAKQLSNPIASLISLPFQLNYDEGFAPDGDGKRTVLNVQPVIPFDLDSE